MYIHETPQWPNFYWNSESISEILAEVRYLQGSLLGRMSTLGFQLQEESNLKILTQDVVKTSDIEGEKLDTEQVRSSIARRLGLEVGGAFQKDRHIEGIVEVMLDATCNYEKPLTAKRLFGWHGALFPVAYSGIQRIAVGKWRTEKSGPMQVVSGPYGRERAHYEAPTYNRLEKEMKVFLNWFEQEQLMDPVLKASIAHFWFVTIHPFEDGNGRIARAITDLQLSRSESNRHRFYSMSSQIQKERKFYYDILEQSQKATVDITSWIAWFLECLKRAILSSEEILKTTLLKAAFWEACKNKTINPRQKLLINRLLEGFEGKLTSTKWGKIAKCSQDTALRDINDLLAKDILSKENAGGRSTNYILNLKLLRD